jgi:two-component system chemotaxis response regulator CheV
MSDLLKNIDARTKLAGTNKLEILLFSLGTDSRTGRRETFGINVFKVREVMRTPPITSAPEMPPSVEGMVSLRGALVPVVDLARYAGVATDTPRSIMIVTEYAGHTQGFLVEGVDTILRLDWSQMRVPPAMLTAEMGGLVTAVTELPDGRLVMMMDVEKILSETTNYDDDIVYRNIKPLDNPELTVFFADDSTVARKQIQRTLEAMGVKYVAAINGLDAWLELEKMAAYAQASGQQTSDLISLVLTDIEMPEMDGYILTKKIKSDPRFIGVPVIMHSSLSGMSNQQLGRSVGVDEYVPKFEPQRLSETLTRRLRQGVLPALPELIFQEQRYGSAERKNLLEGVDARTRLAGSNKMEILLFSLGTRETFGINVFKVREVGRTPHITRTPNMPRGVEGLVSLRGNVIPVLSLISFLEHKDQHGEYGKTMMVAEYSKRTLGFLVHEVDRIIRVDWEKVKAPESVLASNQGLITAVTELDDGKLVSILDVEQILANAFGEAIIVDIPPAASMAMSSLFFADDSLVARRKITEVLDKLGVKHKHATNGAEAWSRLQAIAAHAIQTGRSVRDEIRLILVDAEMPEMDGYVLTKNIKSDLRFTGIPVVMHSSLSSQANHAMGKAVGVDAYVAKFDAEVLADTLRPLLER